ncbi:MAG: LysE family transporter [Cyanobacteria bacterium P01_A01_bin.105]
MNMIFLRGLLLGFSIAAPVGPIGLLCIRRTLAHGRWSGLMSGLGAATADGFYGTVAAFGLTFVSQFLEDQSFILRIVGGLFLCYLGVTTFRSKPPEQAATDARTGLVGAYLSTLFLTLTNPATILSFVLIFAGLAPTGLTYVQASILVAGTFIGSALWWLFLSGGVSLLRHRLTPQHLQWLNRICGVLITGFGILALGIWQQGVG